MVYDIYGADHHRGIDRRLHSRRYRLGLLVYPISTSAYRSTMLLLLLLLQQRLTDQVGIEASSTWTTRTVSVQHARQRRLRSRFLLQLVHGFERNGRTLRR